MGAVQLIVIEKLNILHLRHFIRKMSFMLEKCQLGYFVRRMSHITLWTYGSLTPFWMYLSINPF